jgi:hypothetical protein
MIHLTLALLLNSKQLLIIFTSLLLSACGVKSDPRPPSDSILPSIGEKYLIKDLEKDDKKKSKDGTKKEEK